MAGPVRMDEAALVLPVVGALALSVALFTLGRWLRVVDDALFDIDLTDLDAPRVA